MVPVTWHPPLLKQKSSTAPKVCPNNPTTGNATTMVPVTWHHRVVWGVCIPYPPPPRHPQPPAGIQLQVVGYHDKLGALIETVMQSVTKDFRGSEDRFQVCSSPTHPSFLMTQKLGGGGAKGAQIQAHPPPWIFRHVTEGASNSGGELSHSYLFRNFRLGELVRNWL